VVLHKNFVEAKLCIIHSANYDYGLLGCDALWICSAWGGGSMFIQNIGTMNSNVCFYSD